MRTRSKISAEIRSRARSGFALLIVLFVLIALLLLAAPFLLMSRNADRASTEHADRAEVRLALDAAARHARLQLGESHPALDKTPYSDSEQEVAADNRFDPAFLDPNDPKGLMWNVESRDVAGEVDLNSAPPQMIANLMGISTRFSRAIKADEKEVPLATTSGFEPAGIVWAGGELLRYTKIEDGALVQPVRGVLGPANASQWHGGPLPPSAHDAGAPVIDQRAFAPAMWRIAGGDGDLRDFDSKERLREAGGFVMAAGAAADPKKPSAPTMDSKIATRAIFSEDALRPLFLHGSVHGGVRGGHVWQRGVRLVSAVQGGRDGILRVDNARWFNPGSTVQIADGTQTELALVQEVRKSGEIVLDRILQADYEAGSAIVRVLARRPVNVNTASETVLEALFANLQVAGRNSRITRDEAAKLASLVVESRPFEGWEDFLRRVVLPAGGIEKLPSDAPVVPATLAGAAPGAGIIDPDDALALYMNGLNANDAGLAYSTMPYSFVTRDTYDLELRATVDAPSGVERFSLVREETDVVVPQRPLFALWARQEDFEESLRLDLEAPWWMTGPNATSRWDNGSVPPSRLWAGMGTAEGKAYLPGVTDMSEFKDRSSPPTAEHVFASREEAGWIHLWPSRVGWSKRNDGRVMHFDHETRDPEGRYLPDQVVSRATDDAQVGWTSGKSPMCRPLSFSLWIKPRAVVDSRILDVGGTGHDSDRVSLLFEGADLVLRVIAAGGDHPDTAEKEWSEARFAIAKGTSPGIPTDVWSHVEVDVRGTRPDQISLLVNGLSHGVRPQGLSRLATTLTQNAGPIPLESVEGFPATCTIRAGNELIEALVDHGHLTAARQETGKLAGFGGRLAREEYGSLSHLSAIDDKGASLPLNIATLDVNHPAGTTVEVYGYSLPLLSKVAIGHAGLPADLTPFRAARLDHAVGGQNQNGDIVVVVDPNNPMSGAGGTGIEGTHSRVTGLVLAGADQSMQTNSSIPPEQYMPAFNKGGGYAAIVQYDWFASRDPNSYKTVAGTYVGGVEVIRYSGWDGTTLTIAERGDAVANSGELKNLQGLDPALQRVIGGARAFVAQWDPSMREAQGNTYGGQPLNQLLRWQTYVIPISLPVPGSNSVNGYATATTDPHLAQITHIDDAENTEWIRYDEFTNQALVRDDPAALIRLVAAAANGMTGVGAGAPPPPPPGNGGGGNGGGGNGGGNAADLVAPPPASPEPPAQSYSTQWDPRLGKSENGNFPLSETLETVFQFRGVFGTFSHTHKQGAVVLPVFTTSLAGPDTGRPGRLDAAFLVGPAPDHLGWPVRVHRAHVPSRKVGITAWTQNAVPGPPVRNEPSSGGQTLMTQDSVLLNKTYVALQKVSPDIFNPDPSPASPDPRLRARLVCPPSGELPRIVGRVAVGGAFDGGSTGAVPAATVDEIVFADAQFGRKAPGDPDTLAGTSLVLVEGVGESDSTFKVAAGTLRTANGDFGMSYEVLGELPQDAGLLKIGDEIVAYDNRDPSSGILTIAPSGRGLLGTRPQPHQKSEPITFLEHHPVSFLAGGVSASDASIQIANVEDFPPEGTVLIGSELIHYTRIHESSLEMPRASSVPGAMDRKGNGLFRGRYGTLPAGHAQGEVVILFPFRYWDRWQSRADAPELAYFTLSVDQPSAYWDSCFFVKEDADSVQIGVLERDDPSVPWDADPDNEPKLHLYWKGDVDGHTIPIGHQSDRIDWRVFAKYAPGAFDLKTGLAHGWKQTPTLRRFAATYYGPGMVLSSVER